MTPVIAANWLNISINLLLVIHVIVCLLLALVVLMQRPKQEGLGAAFGSGLTDQAFGARTTDVLQKGTVYLGTLFFVITLVLAILIGKRQNIDHNMSDDSTDQVEEVVPNVPAPEDDKDPVTMPDSDDEADAPVIPAPAEPVTPPAETPEETPEAPAPPAEPAAPAAPVTPPTPAEPEAGGDQ